ncbi:hypothetical protein GCM10010446_12440 [Streptomyces enissocaesilis]|uniref:Uncharacterized protein n=1 Tax=Streptomyces enissocaesilis TaxID=332589 RepID=A0ABP6JFM8_9ACTN
MDADSAGGSLAEEVVGAVEGGDLERLLGVRTEEVLELALEGVASGDAVSDVIEEADELLAAHVLHVVLLKVVLGRAAPVGVMGRPSCGAEWGARRAASMGWGQAVAVVSAA